MFDTVAFRATLAGFGILTAFCGYVLAPDRIYWAAISIFMIAFILAIKYRFRYLHPAVVFCAPWLAILFFSAIPISNLHQSLDPRTYVLILGAIFSWLLGIALAKDADVSAKKLVSLPPNASSMLLLFAICYGCFAAEVAIAGYVPIISLLFTGDSGYADFGLPTVHGAILAYANALGVAALYCYFQTGRRLYFGLYLSILGILIATVTRQSTLTLLVETIIVRCFARAPLKTSTVIYTGVAVLLAFSAFGELRSGDILDIVKVAPEYEHLPKATVWAYAYSYFNAMNLQNMILNSGAPYFDGSMFNSLLPSFLRPASVQESFIVYASLTVTSYLDPVYRDVGLWGAIGITFLIAIFTAKAYNKAIADRAFAPIATYACLYFCALMAFFINFWFYLPVIFQIPFFFIIQKLIFGKSPEGIREGQVVPQS
jgi:oligosaccharide repeat unit polymerase